RRIEKNERNGKSGRYSRRHSTNYRRKNRYSCNKIAIRRTAKIEKLASELGEKSNRPRRSGRKSSKSDSQKPRRFESKRSSDRNIFVRRSDRCRENRVNESAG